MRQFRIHILGASGSGVSTLGKRLASFLSMPYFDCDDFFWEKTNPPFQNIIPRPERMLNLFETLQPHKNWVLSGSQDSWSAPFEELYTEIVFLYVPTDVRLDRIKAREQKAWGSRILPGGDMHENHKKFLDWSAQYDQGNENGRSLPRHKAWLAIQKCPVFEFDGNVTPDALFSSVVEKLKLQKS